MDDEEYFIDGIVFVEDDGVFGVEGSFELFIYGV